MGNKLDNGLILLGQWKASKGSSYCYNRKMYEQGDCAFQRVMPTDTDSTEEINYYREFVSI